MSEQAKIDLLLDENDNLFNKVHHLEQEVRRLKNRLENKVVFVLAVNEYVHDIFDEYWKADEYKKDFEAGINTKSQIEIPELNSGEDAELDRFNLAVKMRSEADNFKGAEIHRYHVK